MSTTKAPICAKCGKPMKKVIYGMPAGNDLDFDKYIYAGCIMDENMKHWDCLCALHEDEDGEAPAVEFQIVVADITSLEVDAIVNAANPQLLRGSGVCGAIFAAAGPGLDAECRERYPHGIEPGQAVITGGHKSKAKWIVHAVAPKANGDGFGDHVKLSNAYRNAILAADEAGAASIAIPSLGTGIYGWSVERAAAYVINDGILSTFSSLRNIRKVLLCCFSQSDERQYSRHFRSQSST